LIINYAVRRAGRLGSIFREMREQFGTGRVIAVYKKGKKIRENRGREAVPEAVGPVRKG
jgi:hypothetical protein